MRFATFLLVVLTSLGTAFPAAGQGLAIDELRAGVFSHDAYEGFLPTGPENWRVGQWEDIKFSALFTSPDLDAFRWIGSPRPEIGTTLSLTGRESLVHANLNWQIPLFDTPIYLELGFGAALTNAELSGAPAPARNVGCALNFYEALGIGADLGDNWTATIRYEHISNNDICSPNAGLSNLGLMIGHKF